MVGEADLAWPRLRASADQRRRRHGVMRRTEWPQGQEAALGRHEAGRRVHGGRLQRLLECPRREQAGQATRQHRLAGPRGTGEEQIVMPRGRDLERTSRERLPLDVGDVGRIDLGDPGDRRRGERRRLAVLLQGTEGLGQRTGATHVHAGHQPGLGDVATRHDDEVHVGGPGGQCGWQDPSTGERPPVQRQFAEHDRAGRQRWRQLPGGREHRHGDGQVETAPGFPQVGRREIDRDPMRREVEAHAADGAADPVAALTHAGVGQTDDGEPREPVADIGLDVDEFGRHPHQRCSERRGKHAVPPARSGAGAGQPESRQKQPSLARRA